MDEAKKPTAAPERDDGAPTIMDMDPFAFAVEERLSNEAGCVADAVTKIVRQATCNEASSLQALHLSARKLEASKAAFVELRNSRDAKERALQKQIQSLQADLHQAQLETIVVQQEQQQRREHAKPLPPPPRNNNNNNNNNNRAEAGTQTQPCPRTPCSRCRDLLQELDRTKGLLAVSQCDYKSECTASRVARDQAGALRSSLEDVKQRAQAETKHLQNMHASAKARGAQWEARCLDAETRLSAHKMSAEEQSHVISSAVLAKIFEHAQATYPTGLYHVVMGAVHLAAHPRRFVVEEYGSRGRALRHRPATGCSDLDLCIVFDNDEHKNMSCQPSPPPPPPDAAQFLRRVAHCLPESVTAVIVAHPGTPCPTLKVSSPHSRIPVDVTVDFPRHPRKEPRLGGALSDEETLSVVCKAVAFWKALLEHNGLDTIPRGSVRTVILWHACAFALRSKQLPSEMLLSEVMLCTGEALLNVEELVGTPQLIVRSAVQLLSDGANPRVLCLTPLLRSRIPGLS